MANKTTTRGRITIKRKLVPLWDGIGGAAEALGVTPTQVRRHITGREFSGKLEKEMKRLGITVEHAV